MARAVDVAAALFERLGPMTTMKLQKLLYYCQAWHLVRCAEPLFAEEIQAWQQGPVVRDLFRLHKGQRELTDWPYGRSSKLSAAERHSVDWVVEQYGSFSASELSLMTHMEPPWYLAREGLSERAPSDATIDLETIATYFARQPADSDGAVRHAIANAEIEGAVVSDAFREKLGAVAEGNISADELVRELVRLRGRD
jgi:uncharacterized phage-associated protein